ncbi:hypothetical protein FJ366_03420, partial [Candidatus Dependentiae bacterium]|nr:hypothetical protein [Candidatus Dependentiae bacterium]
NNKELFSQYIYFINNKSFNAYSFKAIPNIPWMMQNDMPSESLIQPAQTGSNTATINSDDYNPYGWKQISSSPTDNFTLSFEAKATTDLHIGFQDIENNLLHITLGGWNNTQSAISFIKENKALTNRYIPSQKQATPSSKVIPDETSFVKYAVTVSAGCLYITANNIPLINFSHNWIKERKFSSYSFKKWSGAQNWMLQSAAIIPTIQIQNPAPVLTLEADEKEIFADDYPTFGWKNLTNTNSLNFSAKGNSDIHIGLQHGPTSYIELVIGGWSNTKSVVRNFTNDIQTEESFSEPGVPQIPDSTSFVNYSITINNGIITVTANQNQIISQSMPSLVGKTFSRYSFRAWSDAPSWILKESSTTNTFDRNGFEQTRTAATQAMQTLQTQVNRVNQIIADAKTAFSNLATQIKYSTPLPW